MNNVKNCFSDPDEQTKKVQVGKTKLSPREFLCPGNDFQITLDEFLEKLPTEAAKLSLGPTERDLILSHGNQLRFRKPLLYLTRIEWKRPDCKKLAIWRGTPYLIFPRNAGDEVPALVYQCEWVPVFLPRNHIVTRYEHFLAYSRKSPAM